jgi:PKD repeat protein
MKIAAAAILMCAVMVLVAGAPLVVADTHHILKGAQGPRASAQTWTYTPTESGIWTGHIVNSGLRSLVIDVEDVTTGAASSILHQRIRFAAYDQYPSGMLDTNGVIMGKNHRYNITATPNGPQGTSCTVDDVFTSIPPPVAAFTYTVTGAIVSVDGSTSSDPNLGASIAGWGWEWGDGTVGTGMTTSHRYTAAKTYTITLTVLSSTGMTGSTSHDVTLVDSPPVASFTAIPTDLTVSVDASASTDDFGIAGYDWNWGDVTAHGSGMITTHTYAASGTYLVTLTVTDSKGQATPASNPVTVVGGIPKPVAVFTADVTGPTVRVNGMNSTSSAGALSYSWNWGDNVTGPSGVTASHTYLITRTYTITLTVTDTLGQKGTASKTVSIANSAIPPLPYYVVGTVYASDGVTPLAGCTVTITDVRTGTTLIGVVSDDTGFYAGDISPMYQLVGDNLIVNVIGPAGQTGSGTGVIGTDPYVSVNVTLSP